MAECLLEVQELQMGPNNSKAGQFWASSQTQALQTYRLQLNLQTDVASIHEFLTADTAYTALQAWQGQQLSGKSRYVWRNLSLPQTGVWV